MELGSVTTSARGGVLSAFASQEFAYSPFRLTAPRTWETHHRSAAAPAFLRADRAAPTSYCSNVAVDAVVSLDPGVMVAELTALLIFAHVAFASVGRRRNLAHDDVVTLAQKLALSVTELATVVTLVAGLLVFDAFAAVTEEDLVDVAALAVLGVVLATFVGLFVAVDAHYYYMVSCVSGADAAARVILGDIVNNALCALRVIFC